MRNKMNVPSAGPRRFVRKLKQRRIIEDPIAVPGGERQE